MKVKTIVAWTVKVTVAVLAPGGFFVAAYEVWKWWKRHDQKPQPLENKAKATPAAEEKTKDKAGNE